MLALHMHMPATLQGLQGKEDVALILDDSPDKWPQHQQQLICIARYNYWPKQGFPLLPPLEQDEHAASDMMAAAQDLVMRTRQQVLDNARTAARAAFPLPWPRRDVPHALSAVRLQVIIHLTLAFLSVKLGKSSQLIELLLLYRLHESLLASHVFLAVLGACWGQVATERICLWEGRGEVEEEGSEVWC